MVQPDVRATEQGARFLPADHCDNASDDARQDPSRTSLGWEFCTMNTTALSTSAFGDPRTGMPCLWLAGDALH